MNSGEGVGGQGVAQGASPQRPSAQGAGSGTPAWGSSNLPDPWGAAWEAARWFHDVQWTRWSERTILRELVPLRMHQLVKDQTEFLGPSEGPDPPPGFAPQEGPFGSAEGNQFWNWYSGWQDEAWHNWRRPHGGGGGGGGGGVFFFWRYSTVY